MGHWVGELMTGDTLASFVAGEDMEPVDGPWEPEVLAVSRIEVDLKELAGETLGPEDLVGESVEYCAPTQKLEKI